MIIAFTVYMWNFSNPDTNNGAEESVIVILLHVSLQLRAVD